MTIHIDRETGTAWDTGEDRMSRKAQGKYQVRKGSPPSIAAPLYTIIY